MIPEAAVEAARLALEDTALAGLPGTATLDFSEFAYDALEAAAPYMREANNNELNAMNGTEWPEAVGKIWDDNRSRFSTPWVDLSHHDQVAIYRILIREEQK